MRLRITRIFSDFRETRLGGLLFDTTLVAGDALWAVAWSAAVLLIATDTLFEGGVPSEAWLGTVGLPLFIGNHIPFISSVVTASGDAETSLYTLVPLTLFLVAFAIVHAAVVGYALFSDELIRRDIILATARTAFTA